MTGRRSPIVPWPVGYVPQLVQTGTASTGVLTAVLTVKCQIRQTVATDEVLLSPNLVCMKRDINVPKDGWMDVRHVMKKDVVYLLMLI